MWLHSSVGRATHRSRRSRVRIPLKPLVFFFRLLLSNCLNWKIYCDDHSSLSILKRFLILRNSVKHWIQKFNSRVNEDKTTRLIIVSFNYNTNTNMWQQNTSQCKLSRGTWLYDSTMFGPAATQYHVLTLFLFCLTCIALNKLHKCP